MTLYEQLRVRDDVECSDLQGANLKEELIAMAEADVAPPWVPIRAASCLIQLYPSDPTVVDKAKEWVGSSEFVGLGLVVVGKIDTFSLSDGVAIAREVKGEKLLKRVVRSERPEVVDAAGGGR